MTDYYRDDRPHWERVRKKRRKHELRFGSNVNFVCITLLLAFSKLVKSSGGAGTAPSSTTSATTTTDYCDTSVTGFLWSIDNAADQNCFSFTDGIVWTRSDETTSLATSCF